MRFLLTGGRAPVALDLARQLAHAGHAVFVADSAPCFLAGSSNAVARAFRIPPPRQRPQAFADAVAGIARRERIDLVVPTCEEVFYVARFAARIGAFAPLFCPSFAVLERLHDKWQFVRLAAELGIDVPRSRLLTTPHDVDGLVAEAGDLVCKPVFSRFAVHTLMRPSPAELARLRPTAQRAWIAQEFVAGRELCTYSVACAGVLTAHATYHPAWRAGRVGSSYYFAPVEHPGIEAVVARIVEALGYTGQIAFDFIEGPDGRVVVLECNPRATSGLHLFGPGDGLAAAFMNSNGRIARPQEARARMLAPAMVLLGSAQALRRRRLRAFASDFKGARDALWSRTDPLPAFYLYIGLAAFVVAGLQRGVSPTTASTHDIEWDGEPIA